MNGIMVYLDECSLEVSANTYEKIKSFVDFLSSLDDNHISIPSNILGVTLIISYDKLLDEIKVYEADINIHKKGKNRTEYAKIDLLANDNRLDFSFKDKEALCIKDNEYFYIDRYGLFAFVNDILDYEAFKIKKIW